MNEMFLVNKNHKCERENDDADSQCCKLECELMPCLEPIINLNHCNL